MGLELAKKEIDGSVYEFEQFGAKKATKLLIRLTKIIGPALSIAIAEISKAGSKEDAKKLSSTVFGQSIQALVMNVGNEDEAIALMEAFASEKCLCDGKKINFDTHYQNKLLHLGKVLAAALEVQYGNFFEEVTGLLGAVQAPTSQENPA